MKAERPDRCREWRPLLGAYALGDLPDEERTGLEAHLEGCPECRAEVASLGAVARLLPLADPGQFDRPAPRPEPGLGDRIVAEIGVEQRVDRHRRRRRVGLALSGAVATAAAVAAIVVLAGGGDEAGGPEQHIHFSSLPAGIKIGATLEPHAYGTAVRVYVKGVRSGTLCRVFLRGRRGERVSAGSFRYRWGEDSTAQLSAALDLSRTTAIGVRAGKRTFVAPVGADAGEAAGAANREA